MDARCKQWPDEEENGAELNGIKKYIRFCIPLEALGVCGGLQMGAVHGEGVLSLVHEHSGGGQPAGQVLSEALDSISL